ncbi:MAG: globin domain-containing protein [Verrucomicrobia bacterium]|nr:globin domain-containing protein [Verrucomicrobiota bacterium]
MSPRHKYLIRKSFALLEEQGSVPALVFYRRLFEIDPSLRPLFKNDIEALAEKLIEMLGSLISQLERTAVLEAELQLMGQRHATYGVLPQHYDTVGRALIHMLAETLHGEFTPEVREAWTSLYLIIAETMQLGANQVLTVGREGSDHVRRERPA